jgi:Ca-activated chloride channel homolog
MFFGLRRAFSNLRRFRTTEGRLTLTTARRWSSARGLVIALSLPALLLTGFLGRMGSQAPAATGVQAEDPFRISVNVDLVLLHATVRDRKGQQTSGLLEQSFEVYEDGLRQAIRLFRHEDVPVTVGLVVDHSGSMRGKLTDVVAAARTFVRFSNQDDQMFVVNFNEKVTLGLPGGIRFTNRLDQLESAILKAPAAGQTALYDAIASALDQLQAGAQEKKVLIVISDGGDNVSRHRLAAVLRLARQSSALIYTIGIFAPEDPDRNPNVLRQLARDTGGEAFFPGELKDAVAICERIARDIRNQYTLGYISSNTTKPGTYRKIRVSAAAAEFGRLSVRVRAGYTASGEAVKADRGK